jgi:hypothetical protein
MVLAWLLPLIQFVPAFVALDLFFRFIDVAPEGLPGRVRRYGARYGLLAAVCIVGTAWCQWLLAGPAGAAAAPLGALPWWMLWRFGLRKQLTHLFKDDGGRALDIQKTDPN